MLSEIDWDKMEEQQPQDDAQVEQDLEIASFIEMEQQRWPRPTHSAPEAVQ